MVCGRLAGLRLTGAPYMCVLAQNADVNSIPSAVKHLITKWFTINYPAVSLIICRTPVSEDPCARWLTFCRQ
jgi:hypothetical protein